MRKKNRPISSKGMKTMLLGLSVMSAGILSCGQTQEAKEHVAERKEDVEKITVIEELPNSKGWENKVIHGVQMDSIVFDYEIYEDSKAHYCIPRVVSDDDELSPVVNSINKKIYDALDYSDDEWERGNWCENSYQGVNFSYEIGADVLLIDMYVDSYSAHGGYEHEVSILFDLTTGSEIAIRDIRFSALFSTKGYFDFLNERGWSDSIKNAFVDGYKSLCMEESDDITKLMDVIENEYRAAKFFVEYRVEEDSFKFLRDMDSYVVMPWSNRCYEPYYADKCSFDEIRPYLSAVGEQLLLKKPTTKIERILWHNELYKQIEKCLYLEMYTTPEGNETCRMAINYQDSLNVYGYLYDDVGGCEEIVGDFRDRRFIMHTSKVGDISFNLDSLKNYQVGERQNFVGFHSNM